MAVTPREPGSGQDEVEQQEPEDLQIALRRPILIPPGRYEAIGRDWAMKWDWGNHKLRVNFWLPSPSITLVRHYNIQVDDENRLYVGPRSNYAMEWELVSGQPWGSEGPDSLHPEVFQAICQVEVETVRTGRAIADYSKIKRVLGRQAGGGRA